MDITFGHECVPFRHWRPADGRLLSGLFAYNVATFFIDPEREWLAPSYVMGAAFDGRFGVFVSRQHVGEFFRAHDDALVVMHHAALCLAVLDKLVPDVGVYDRVDSNSVYDTQILHQLHALALVGDTAADPGEFTLEFCAETYLGVTLPNDVTDTRGRVVWQSYGQWIDRPLSEVEPIYLDRLAQEAIAMLRIFGELYAKIKALLDGAVGVWSSISPNWLRECWDEWGPQTHHIQLKAAIALRAVTANGLTIDCDAQEALAARLEALMKSELEALTCSGYLPGGKASSREIQAMFERLEAECYGVRFPRTATGSTPRGPTHSPSWPTACRA